MAEIAVSKHPHERDRPSILGEIIVYGLFGIVGFLTRDRLADVLGAGLALTLLVAYGVAWAFFTIRMVATGRLRT